MDKRAVGWNGGVPACVPKNVPQKSAVTLGWRRHYAWLEHWNAIFAPIRVFPAKAKTPDIYFLCSKCDSVTDKLKRAENCRFLWNTFWNTFSISGTPALGGTV